MSLSVTTARGDVAPETLGLTSMHEHLNADLSVMIELSQSYGAPMPPPERLTLRNENLDFLRSGGGMFSREAMTIGDLDYTVAELTHFRAIGGGAIVDASPIGLRGDPTLLREASARSDVQVVFATGLYTEATRPAEFSGWTEDQQVELFSREILEGVAGTGVRPGFLKCALSSTQPGGPLSEVELTTLRACARVAQETGLSVHVHSAFPMSDDQVLAGARVILDDMGLAPDRLVMMHLDSFLRPWDARSRYIGSLDTTKSISTDLHERLLDLGVNLGFDSWGSAVRVLPEDDDRLKALIHLVRSGYGGQITLGHDITQKPEGISYGGHGFTWFHGLVPAAFQEAGVPAEAYERLTVENPARILSH